MASAKDIKKKIRSVTNTRKITRTMEMVSTVKAKRGQDSLKALSPYATRLDGLLEELARSSSIEHPLLAIPEGPAEPGDAGSGRSSTLPGTGAWTPDREEARKAAGRTLLLVVTGNRGLCGGYNSNVLHLAERFVRAEREAGREVELHVVGKKGVIRLRFRKIPMARTNTILGDNPSFAEAEAMCQEYIDRFLAGEVDQVVVIATRYLSSSVQRPVETRLLPFSIPGRASAEGESSPGLQPGGGPRVFPPEFIFEPDRKAVLEALIPLAVKNLLFRILVEARASEHMARRVAMKMATDNAEQMIRSYTTKYNRQRQASITQQIVEVVSGADAQG